MAEAIKRIIAAGTVVLRPTEGRGPEVLLVHRPRYDDWTTWPSRSRLIASICWSWTERAVRSTYSGGEPDAG